MKLALIFAGVLGFGLVLGNVVTPPTAQQSQEDDQELDDIKGKVRQDFMRGKLLSNQQIVEGLSTNNFDLIAKGADGVTALVKGQHWFVVDTPQYREYSDDMTSAAVKLKAAAVDKNLEASTLRYFELTLKCVDCHQYYMQEF